MPLIGLLLANWKIGVYAVVVLAFLAFAGSWYLRGEKISELRGQVVQLEDTIRVRDAQLAIAQTTTRVTSDRVIMRDAVRSRADILRGQINATPPSDDAPVAPVLRDALTGIRGLRSNPTDTNRRPADSR